MRIFIKAFCVGAMMVSFMSCKSNTKVNDPTLSDSIVGTWELRQGQNSMTPTQEYPPGNGNLLKFSDSSYERYRSGKLIESGRYHIAEDTTVMAEVGLELPPGQFANRIVFDTMLSSPKTFMELSNNRLTLLSGYFPTDGGSKSIYERQAKKRE